MVERNCERYGIGVRDKFIAKIVTSAIKRNMLNKAKNNTENHSEHMRNIHNLNKKWLLDSDK